MSFVNVGAYWVGSGDSVRTKTALKQALRDAPETVGFYKTSPLDQSGLPTQIAPSDIPEGVTLTVAGPSPYTKRDWFASVSKKPDGGIRVT